MESSLLVPKRKIILSILKENGQLVPDEADFSFTRLGEGKGFASLLYKVQVGMRSYAVKITNSHGQLDGFGDLGIHRNLHNREYDFYLWATSLPQSVRAQFKTPEFFGGRLCEGDEEGILIIEDLSGRMSTDFDYKDGMSIELVKEIIQSITSYQTVHLHSENKLFIREKKELYDSLAVIIKGCIDNLPEKPWLTEAAKHTLRRYAEQVAHLTEDYPDFAENAPLTLIHCDLWPNNMMYEEVGGAKRLLAIIDWQTVTVGNALFDIAVLCAVSLTAEARRAKEQELVEFYWTEMQRKCEQLGTPFNVTLNMAHKLYLHCLRWSALVLVMMLSFQKDEDTPDENANDGPLSTRLKALLEDLTEQY